jgi:hypothetical protein
MTLENKSMQKGGAKKVTVCNIVFLKDVNMEPVGLGKN